nr:hypothetical protein [Jiangella alkaliphila]
MARSRVDSSGTTRRSRSSTTTATTPSATNRMVPTTPTVTSSPRYWLSKMRYFGRNVPSPRPNHGCSAMNDDASEKLSVRDAMLGSSAAPVNSPTIEFSSVGVTNVIATTPATPTPRTSRRRTVGQPMAQITTPMIAPT